MPAGEVRDNCDPNACGEGEHDSHGSHLRASLALLGRGLLFVAFMNHKDKTTKTIVRIRGGRGFCKVVSTDCAKALAVDGDTTPYPITS